MRLEDWFYKLLIRIPRPVITLILIALVGLLLYLVIPIVLRKIELGLWPGL